MNAVILKKTPLAAAMVLACALNLTPIAPRDRANRTNVWHCCRLATPQITHYFGVEALITGAGYAKNISRF